MHISSFFPHFSLSHKHKNALMLYPPPQSRPPPHYPHSVSAPKETQRDQIHHFSSFLFEYLLYCILFIVFRVLEFTVYMKYKHKTILGNKYIHTYIRMGAHKIWVHILFGFEEIMFMGCFVISNFEEKGKLSANGDPRG